MAKVMELLTGLSYLLGVVDAFIMAGRVKAFLTTRPTKARGEEQFYKKKQRYGSLAGFYVLLAIGTVVAGRPAFYGLFIGLGLWFFLYFLQKINWRAIRESLRNLGTSDDDDDDDRGSGDDYFHPMM